MAAKLTATMIRHLVNAAANTNGMYATNISNGGGTAGALLNRGLIEYRNAGSEPSGYYLTAAGFAAVQK
jgi:hypothetical protein